MMAHDTQSLSSVVSKSVETEARSGHETSRGNRLGRRAELSLECNYSVARLPPSTFYHFSSKFLSTSSLDGRQSSLIHYSNELEASRANSRDKKNRLQDSSTTIFTTITKKHLKANEFAFRRRLKSVASKAKEYSTLNTTLQQGRRKVGKSPFIVKIIIFGLLTLASLQLIQTSVRCEPSEDPLNSLNSAPTTTPEFTKASYHLGATESLFNLTTIAQTSISTTTAPLPATTATQTTTTANEDVPSAEHDDSDAEGCEGISASESEETKNITDNERLVNLQSCIQRKVKRKLISTARSGMELFDELTLTGGCSASLLNLMASLGEIKSFAFKFLDASAKIPSGMMYGLLSDYGDFDQCLSIRSNTRVPIEDELEEGTYSGKYCLMSVKLNYHVTLAPNSTVPDGILPDGVLWDELIRNYWTSNSSKGFQVGMCFPSRCTNNDLEQIFKLVASRYNVIGDVISCQDNHDLKRQYKPDLVQRTIISAFYTLLMLSILGTFIDRYYPETVNQCQQQTASPSSDSNSNGLSAGCRQNTFALLIQVIICFSMIKNWNTFMRKGQQLSSSRSLPSLWDSQQSNSPTTSPSCYIETETEPLNETKIGSTDIKGTASLDKSASCTARMLSSETIDFNSNRQLTVQIQPTGSHLKMCSADDLPIDPLLHLSGLRLFVIVWITIGYSFMYPSAHNYQYYRSIIGMKVTQHSVWFATTNFTLGIDMLLYMTGFVFVYKLAHLNLIGLASNCHAEHRNGRTNSSTKFQVIKFCCGGKGILRFISMKILRFWPTYLTVIALAIVAPLLSDGPMWPEMVSERIAGSCRRNWWANMLFINNYSSESQICLPSSWFISVMMQCLLIGSIIIVLVRKFSLNISMSVLTMLLICSSLASFSIAYKNKLRAPIIKMDESFVMELDGNIFRLYTNIFNNLGPFLVGMVGGFLLIESQINASSKRRTTATQKTTGGRLERCRKFICGLTIQLLVASIGVVVLSSVFFNNYSLFWSSIYWSLHRVGWAIVTGYIIHNCATGRWKLINDLLSLSTFIPLSRLIFIAYLVYPIFIHIHSGLVRDGLHVSIYNMLNIYITRLVMTFTTALIVHLLVELPFCSIEEIFLNSWFWMTTNDSASKNNHPNKPHLLFAAAPLVYLNYSDSDKTGKEVVVPIVKGDKASGVVKSDSIIDIS